MSQLSSFYAENSIFEKVQVSSWFIWRLHRVLLASLPAAVFLGVGHVQAVPYLDIFHKNISKVPPPRRIRTFSAARSVSLSDELLA